MSIAIEFYKFYEKWQEADTSLTFFCEKISIELSEKCKIKPKSRLNKSVEKINLPGVLS